MPPTEYRDPIDLPSMPVQVVDVTANDRNWAMAAHLTALIGEFSTIGIASFVGPLVCWLARKDASAFVDYHGKESLNFQISMLLALVPVILIAIFTCGVGALLLIPLYLLRIVAPIVAGVKASNAQDFRYPLTVRFIK